MRTLLLAALLCIRRAQGALEGAQALKAAAAERRVGHRDMTLLGLAANVVEGMEGWEDGKSAILVQAENP